MAEPFEEIIQQQIQNLAASRFREMEATSIQKRKAWIAKNYTSGEPVTPRKAYEMLFFDYMGLQPEDVPVVFECETEIIWLSYNPCPTLEACRQLNLDTRQVCRAVSEGPAQAFVSALDPLLQFGRSYEEIRPYTDYCMEWIKRIDE